MFVLVELNPPIGEPWRVLIQGLVDKLTDVAHAEFEALFFGVAKDAQLFYFITARFILAVKVQVELLGVELYLVVQIEARASILGWNLIL